MAISGDAFAQGILKGLGQGMQQHLKDQQRERQNIKQMEQAFKTYKQQQIFSQSLKAIGQETDALGQWETAAKMSTQDIAYQAASKMANNLAAKDRPAFIRDTMKSFSGMSKADLLVRAGYRKADYSQWINNPDYQDAIPRARIAGMADMPDMESTFKYDPRVLADAVKAEGEKVTAYTQKRQDAFAGIRALTRTRLGATPSEGLINTLWQNRPEGEATEVKGSAVVSYDQRMIDSLLQSGGAYQVGTQIKLRHELTSQERRQLGLDAESQGSLQAPTGTAGELYDIPTTEQYLSEQEEKKQKEADKRLVRDIEKSQGKTIKSYQSLESLKEAFMNASPEAREILFGAPTARGVLSISDLAQQVAAKLDVKGAQEAREILSKMTNVSAALKHEQYGSAQTVNELKTFAAQLGDPSILQNFDTLMDQIDSRRELVRQSLESSIGVDGRRAYLAQHPEAANIFASPEESQGTSGAAYRIYDAQGKDLTDGIPAQYWRASPAKQQEFLERYGLTTR